jgi:hypothetical protein
MTTPTDALLANPFAQVTKHTDGRTEIWEVESSPYLDTTISCDYVYTTDQLRAALAAQAEALTAERDALRDAAPLCETHKPNGGKRGVCLVCACQSLSAALSRISYLCGEPNEMGCGPYDVHCEESAVVEQVVALRAERDALVSAGTYMLQWVNGGGNLRTAVIQLRTAIDSARTGGKA